MKRLVLTGETWKPDAEYVKKYLRLVEANRPTPKTSVVSVTPSVTSATPPVSPATPPVSPVTPSVPAVSAPTVTKPQSAASDLSLSEILLPESVRAAGNYSKRH